MKIGTDGINNIPEQERYAKLHVAQNVKKAEQVGMNGVSNNSDVNDLPADEYIPSNPVKGIYKPGKDAEGNSIIDYIDPKRNALPDSKANDKVSKDSPKSETTTMDTDKVDREIEKLKEKRACLEKEIRAAEDDQKKKLIQELRQVEVELVQKDNDNYRRQNAIIS